MGWNITDIPDLSGRTFLVTGANSGLGFETAKALAGAGGQVVLAGRSREKIGAAQRQIPQDTLALELDLSDLASVHAAAESLPVASLDVLVNNAGVMAPPLGRTADGFETQIGTNHLGHFALTGLLLPRMPIDGGDARVVTVSSGAHRMGSVDVDDLNYERRKYSSWPAYGQSKLANLLFMAELDRRAHAAQCGGTPGLRRDQPAVRRAEVRPQSGGQADHARDECGHGTVREFRRPTAVVRRHYA